MLIESYTPQVTLLHNYPEARNDEIRERFEDLFSRIEDRARIRSAHSLALGVTQEMQLGDELVFGGGTNRKFGSEPELREEILTYLKAIGAPAVGVCFGAQALGRAYEARLSRMPEARNGIAPVNVVQSLGALAYGDTFAAREIHSWSFRELPPGLSAYAESEDGVEVFAHDTLPVAGVQFHPELNISETPGALAAFAAAREVALRNRGNK